MPHPLREVLTGRVLQSLDFIEVVMIEPIVDRLEDLLQVRKVHDPTSGFRHLTLDVDLNTERVAVQTPALVPLGHVGQSVRGLECEFFEDFHVHSFVQRI